jgi:hypothetical protein
VLVLSQHVEPEYALRLLEERPARAGYLMKERVGRVEQLLDAVGRGGGRRVRRRPRGRGRLKTFACECGDVSCWETVSLSDADYAAFRAESEDGYLLAPAHDDVGA